MGRFCEHAQAQEERIRKLEIALAALQSAGREQKARIEDLEARVTRSQVVIEQMKDRLSRGR
jgi:uncharacterized coiled-coil protein SlyX